MEPVMSARGKKWAAFRNSVATNLRRWAKRLEQQRHEPFVMRIPFESPRGTRDDHAAMYRVLHPLWLIVSGGRWEDLNLIEKPPITWLPGDPTPGR